MRNELIEQYKPFIAKTASSVCKRFIREEDDEASIGLIAFNEAIEKYAPHKGGSFLSREKGETGLVYIHQAGQRERASRKE
ncbi:RNA polymerase sigma factor SigI [Geobacillus stearothermophilus]|nr:RNA polymerase sigma factor SigI [Geobacillus stearothermophilus]